MALNVREKQREALTRLLHLHTPPQLLGTSGEDEAFKILLLDADTSDVVAPLLRVSDLRRHGVTLHLRLEAPREPVPDAPCVALVSPTPQAVARLGEDMARGLYSSYHVAFSRRAPRALLEDLARRAVAGGAAHRVAGVVEANAQFEALEPDVFSLGLADAHARLNDPGADESVIAAAVADVVERLLCVLATLDALPIIRAPRGGAAEHVARALEARLRDAARGARAGRAGPFAGALARLAGGGGGAGGGGVVGGGGKGAGRGGAGLGGGSAASGAAGRPLLCLFDRSFDLAGGLRHGWSYRPLVHDVLGMRLNRVELSEEGEAIAYRFGTAFDALRDRALNAAGGAGLDAGAGADAGPFRGDVSSAAWLALPVALTAASPPSPPLPAPGPTPPGVPTKVDAKARTKSYDVDESDFFWRAHASEPFPRIAEEIESELKEYREAVSKLGGAAAAAAAAAAGGDAAATDAALAAAVAEANDPSSTTKSLVDAVGALPRLTARKGVLDRHTNLATALLRDIKTRGLDRYAAAEDEALAGRASALDTTLALLDPSAPGTVADKARLALAWLFSAPAPPPEGETARVEAALEAAGARAPAWAYARRLRRLEAQTLAPGAQTSGASAAASAAAAQASEAAAQLSALLGAGFGSALGSGLTTLTRGVKNLLQTDRGSPVASAVAALASGAGLGGAGAGGGAGGAGGAGGVGDAPSTEDAYVRLDPLAEGHVSGVQDGPFQDVIAFVLGGGTYVEADAVSAAVAAGRSSGGGAKRVLYGATELLRGEQFLAQLDWLARRAGM